MADKVNHNTATLDGFNIFHGMGMIAVPLQESAAGLFIYIFIHSSDVQFNVAH